MPGIRVKICGLQREADVEAVNSCLPEFAGFVFADSKRKVSDEQAFLLRRLLLPQIISVGVFVNAEISHIVSLCKEGVIRGVQLHGEEEPAYAKELRRRLGTEALKQVPLIRAVRVQSRKQVEQAQQYPCDYLLLDAYLPGGDYGGNGAAFDRGLLPDLSTPYFLAGGLRSENLRESVDNLKPYALDVSSGVETGGQKDGEKIRNFVAAARQL